MFEYEKLLQNENFKILRLSLFLGFIVENLARPSLKITL